MALKIQDTLSRRKKEFTPVHEGEARMYVCGMTVQDRPHVGHMRAAVVGDMMRRYLEFRGYKVTFVNNFTDVDDKIIARAEEEGVDYQTIAERNMEAYLEASRRLGILPATHYPKATEHIGEIVDLVKRLVDKGMAYESGGDVYYRVSKNAEYGKLSGRRIEELRAGERIEVGEGKEDPLDFTLWKAAKPGEPSWSSPWGDGRPGWHIECSAMSMKYLGETFDFHGGGLDLIFPHHENEIAQSESATGRPFANFWIHNGLVNLSGEKMSKSTKHFFLFEDVTKTIDPMVIRYYLLSTHYRSPIDFSEERLAEAGRAFSRLAETRERAEDALGHLDKLYPQDGLANLEQVADIPDDLTARAKTFLEAMDDDFNSAKALGQLFEAAHIVNRMVDEGPAGAGQVLRNAFGLLDEMMGLLGLQWPERTAAEVPEEVAALARERAEARSRKDWPEADRLRDAIQAKGWQIVDKGKEYDLRPL
ncbi:MAG: cysteine--tRNA ligase [Candidatus Eisenbacteria bacterium]|nr:cysteine--tRNA ligase [Candidatus Eisenbacteria bacterium]